jgi:hypothetical protein
MELIRHPALHPNGWQMGCYRFATELSSTRQDRTARRAGVWSILASKLGLSGMGQDRAEWAWPNFKTAALNLSATLPVGP